MKWIAISGSWKKTNQQVENDTRATVRRIIARGDGIVTGGALGVDFIATDEAIKFFPAGERIKIFLPVTLDIYASHYRKRAGEGVITREQAEELINQLQGIKGINPSTVVEDITQESVDREAYFRRNSEVVEVADELVAFWVNESEGVGDTIQKARAKGIPIDIHSYQIE